MRKRDSVQSVSSRSQTTHVSALIESFEPRLFMSVTSWTSNQISDLSDSYFGEVLFGDNGSTWGYPTTEAGSTDTADTWTFTQWDPNPDDGIESESHEVALSINADGAGSGSWKVDSDSPASFSVASSGTIHQVAIRAAVMGSQMEMDWADVEVDFYQHGKLVETVVPAAPTVSTMDSTNNDPAESVVMVTPTNGNDDGVVVTGSVRLKAAQGTYPGPSDIFGQVLVS